MLKNMKKSTKSNVITLGIVVGFYVLIQILSAAGALTNSFSGQLVPICAYVIMAVSLNLTVGMLGELSLGHAGFMSVGAFSGIVAAIGRITELTPRNDGTPTVRLAVWETGAGKTLLPDVIEAARKAGITSRLKAYPSLALGSV